VHADAVWTMRVRGGWVWGAEVVDEEQEAATWRRLVDQLTRSGQS
jgi:hypothetical protein